MTSVTKKGVESYESEEVFYEYIKTPRFYIDCISLLGAFVFVNIWSKMQYFGVFKMMRVLRMSAMIRDSNMDNTSKQCLNLGKLIFYIFFFIHCAGCLWWIVISYD